MHGKAVVVEDVVDPEGECGTADGRACCIMERVRQSQRQGRKEGNGPENTTPLAKPRFSMNLRIPVGQRGGREKGGRRTNHSLR